MITTVKRDVHLLFTSGDPDEVSALSALLRDHRDVPISVVRQGPLLNGWEELPFLETIDGEHIVGIDAIGKFVSSVS